jgi:hypothetical protein
MMVDKSNPTNQFHPYEAVDATPHSEEPSSGMRDVLNKNVSKARDLARSNPALALGGLAAAAIGLGLMRRRS